jgi:hypothetical protein
MATDSLQNPPVNSNASPVVVLNVEAPKLTEAEVAERSFDLNKLYSISQVRESPQPQFDGMGYMKYNETNEMADISFIPAKKNKMDSRVVSGITHEKDSSLLSLVQSFNFEGKVRIFYKNEENYAASNAMTAWVRKTRELENYDAKRPQYYRNMFVQGTSFVEEAYVEHYVPKKVITGTIDPTKLENVDWVNAGMEKVSDGCVSHLVDGKKVFMEDIRQPNIQLQPGVYTVEYVPREYVRTIWGDSSRWKNVPYKATPSATSGYVTQGSIYSDWTFSEVDYTKCEIIKAYRPFEARYQVYINGVPMLPAGFPLKAISPSGLIPIAKGDLDLMNMYAYSKSIPAKTKMDQAVYDEFIRVLLIKFQQSAFPPRGNMSDQVLSSNILMPGRMNQDLTPDMIPSLLGENHGPTTADFSIVNMLKEQIDSKSISTLLEGNPNGQDVTLGQYMDMQKKQMLKLGGIFDAFINWEKEMLKLRTLNLIGNGAQPIGKIKSPYTGQMINQYRDVSMDDNFGDTTGTHVLKFTEDSNTGIRSSEDIAAQELKYKEETGKAIKYTYIDPGLLREILDDPDYYLCYEVVPVDKNNDKLTQALFVAMITQAANIFGIDSMNVEELKKRYASVMGEDFDDLFLDPQALQMKQQQQQAAAVAAGATPGATEKVPSPTSSLPQVQKMFQ